MLVTNVLDLTKDRSLVSMYTHQRARKELMLKAELAYAVQIIQRSDYLQKCELSTIRNAILDGARIGLTLSPVRREAYLIPQKLKTSDQFPVCFFVPSYIGFEQEVLRSNVVTSIQTHRHFTSDAFRMWTDDDGDHVNWSRAQGDRGTMKGVFCQAKYPNGDRHIEYMDMSMLQACLDAAKRRNFDKIPPAWKFWLDQQQKKCCVRRGAKHWPSNERMEQIQQIMNRNEPMDFGGPADQTEAPTLCLNKTDISGIKKFMIEKGVKEEYVTEQMNLYAASLGYKGGIATVPVDQVGLLKERIAARQTTIMSKEKTT